MSRAQTMEQIVFVGDINHYKKPSAPIPKKGWIYSITSGNHIYIGSTTQAVEERWKQHQDGFDQYQNEMARRIVRWYKDKHNYKCGQGDYKYCSSYEVLKCSDEVFKVVEEHNIYNRSQLFYDEGELIRKYRADDEWICANQRTPGYEKYNNYEQRKKQQKEKRRKSDKQRVKCECGTAVRKDKLKKHRESQKHSIIKGKYHKKHSMVCTPCEDSL